MLLHLTIHPENYSISVHRDLPHLLLQIYLEYPTLLRICTNWWEWLILFIDCDDYFHLNQNKMPHDLPPQFFYLLLGFRYDQENIPVSITCSHWCLSLPSLLLLLARVGFCFILWSHIWIWVISFWFSHSLSCHRHLSPILLPPWQNHGSQPVSRSL